MAKQTLVIDNIWGGHQLSYFQGGESQFLTSIGIDPAKGVIQTGDSEYPGVSGAIIPSVLVDVATTNVNSAVIALITNPKDDKLYAVLSNGRLISWSIQASNGALSSESLIGTVTGGKAHGAFYYNNYIYITGTGASEDDVSRYGPLNNSPTLTNNVWKGATLGSQTALTDTTYPQTKNSVEYLNHHGIVHTDNKAYFCDFKDGKGMIHFIRTTKVTDEGDTDNGSTYNALDLPLGWYPYAISSYGNDIVIAASQTNSTSTVQGESALFFWDTTSPSFYRIVKIPDPICSCLVYSNGILYGVSGTTLNATSVGFYGGIRLFRYIGGDSIQTIKTLAESHPPLQNAIEAYGNKITFAGFTNYPVSAAVLYSWGSTTENSNVGFHSTARSQMTATTSNGVLTAIKAGYQGFTNLGIFTGGTDGTNYEIERRTNTGDIVTVGTSGETYFRSQIFNINRKFTIEKIRLAIPSGISGTNNKVTPTLYFDNERSNSEGTVINTTNYTSLNRAGSGTAYEGYVTLNSSNFNNATFGANNFFLELKFRSNSSLYVALPIYIDVDISDNEND